MSYPNYPAFTGNEPCTQVDPELFYPEGKGRTQDREMSTLRAMCASCDIVAACKAYALHHEGEGYWGGTSPAQRSIERSRRRIVLQSPAYHVYLVKGAS